jgi:hypothetical protein
VTIYDIMAMAGVRSRNTIQLWIVKRGFPRPVDKGGGRSLLDHWNSEAVEDWWSKNKHKVGRHPK